MGNRKYPDRFTDVFQYYRDEQSQGAPKARIREFQEVMVKIIRHECSGLSAAAVKEIKNEAFLLTVRDVRNGKINQDMLGGAYYRIKRAIAAFNKANTVPQQHVLTDDFEQTKHNGILTEDQVEHEEMLGELRTALAQLSDRERTIIYRHQVKEEALADIAKDLGIKNIYKVHADAKARLRKLLQAEWEMYKETKDREYIIAVPKAKPKY
ncbi:hypothetical protein K0T92_16305 [Paenibacillus oenotherae]|uniref:Sigma-70 family RNA polymerase sigma factor n=1 Tax=Paenibacillus oenotherae TaxID=1435645 RepID=A0ABS7D8U6_9BACL|nr:hypothetical protein [Paenibacillus oenotherae]MBW7476296.1 hypothetical protein [Paenibacillus oenotherae]